MTDNTVNHSGTFVNLSDIVPDCIQEIRYFSTYNFIGDRIDGYEEPCALLTEPAAKALRQASDALLLRGYRLKIFDAYRPARAVAHFVRWAKDLEDARMKPYFYPDFEKVDLFRIGYIAAKSSHSRGSTVDLTLFSMKDGREADMGGPFDFFGPLSRADFSDGLTDEQLANRKLLRETMCRFGFVPFEEEWWHFTLRDEPYPDTYFDFPVQKL